MKLQRMCFAVDLRDEAGVIERYKRWHRPGGPSAGVTRSLRDAGIAELEIYLIGNRLFMIMEVEPHYSAEAKARADKDNRHVQEWNALMESLQQDLPLPKSDPASGKWRRMERIYSLVTQP